MLNRRGLFGLLVLPLLGLLRPARGVESPRASAIPRRPSLSQAELHDRFIALAKEQIANTKRQIDQIRVVQEQVDRMRKFMGPN